jgi:hypothetical protein
MKKPSSPLSQKFVVASPSGSIEYGEKSFHRHTIEKRPVISYWAGEGEEPLFYRCGTWWHESARLAELQAKLGLGGNPDAIETVIASFSFSRAVDSAERGLNPINSPKDAELWAMLAEMAYGDIVLPFAWRMRKARSATPEDADKIKQEAFLWLSQVIDHAFGKTPFPHPIKKDDYRAYLLIEIARDLCQTLDRLPKKKEVWEEARKRNTELFSVGEDVERTLLKKAGLDSLPQARKGGKTPFPHPIKKDDYTSYLLKEIARDLCQLLDRLPEKKELWEEARERNPELFTVGEDVERTLLKKAGLDSLPQAQKGGK